jgi:hypothetical protein
MFWLVNPNDRSLRFHPVKTTVVILLAALSICRAEDWAVDGKTYPHVHLLQIEPDRVHISYDGGSGFINIADLPPDIRQRFNYDPVTAKAAVDARAEANAEQVQREQAFQKEQAEQQKQDQAKADSAAAAITIAHKTCHLEGAVLCKLADGKYVVSATVPTQADSGIPAGIHQNADGSWSSTLVSSAVDSQGVPWVQPANVCLVVDGQQFADNDPVNFWVYPTGDICNYTTVLGGRVSLHVFRVTESPWVALKSSTSSSDFNPGSINSTVH